MNQKETTLTPTKKVIIILADVKTVEEKPKSGAGLFL